MPEGGRGRGGGFSAVAPADDVRGNFLRSFSRSPGGRHYCFNLALFSSPLPPFHVASSAIPLGSPDSSFFFVPRSLLGVFPPLHFLRRTMVREYYLYANERLGFWSVLRGWGVGDAGEGIFWGVWGSGFWEGGRNREWVFFEVLFLWNIIFFEGFCVFENYGFYEKIEKIRNTIMIKLFFRRYISDNEICRR